MHKEVNMALALWEEDKMTATREMDSKNKVKVPIYSLQTKMQRKDFLDMASGSYLLLVLLPDLLLLVIVVLLFLLLLLLLLSS